MCEFLCWAGGFSLAIMAAYGLIRFFYWAVEFVADGLYVRTDGFFYERRHDFVTWDGLAGMRSEIDELRRQVLGLEEKEAARCRKSR